MSNQKNAQFRDLLRIIVPSWLSDKGALSKSTGFKVLFSAASCLDGVLQWFVEGAQARMPGIGTSTAIPMISKDRQIVLGPLAYPDPTYSVLTGWLEAWKHAGHPFEILRQIRKYLGPVRCKTVDNSGNWHTIEEDGTETYQQLPGSWDWDGDTDSWARLWVILYAPPSWIPWDSCWTVVYGLWGGALDATVAGYKYTIGQWADPSAPNPAPVPYYEVTDHIRYLVKTWKPQHAKCVNIILAFDPDSFNPLDLASCPDGQWGSWTKGSSPAVMSRNPTARYWGGVSS